MCVCLLAAGVCVISPWDEAGWEMEFNGYSQYSGESSLWWWEGGSTGASFVTPGKSVVYIYPADGPGTVIIPL